MIAGPVHVVATDETLNVMPECTVTRIIFCGPTGDIVASQRPPQLRASSSFQETPLRVRKTLDPVLPRERKQQSLRHEVLDSNQGFFKKFVLAARPRTADRCETWG